MAKLIGNRYASSLFEVGLELNKIDKFQEELGLINNILKLKQDLKYLLIQGFLKMKRNPWLKKFLKIGYQKKF